jgi:GTP diphosphokinase / guanosine-3',5'-bis(diphosphate) 3'-diphosphatase
MEITDLIREVKKYNKKSNSTLIKKAYAFAKEHHGDQKRATGGPYIEHPLEVAMILTQLHMDDVTLAGALLHDVVEDTPVTKKDLTSAFGVEIAQVVDGVTKITSLKAMSKEEYHAATIRKVILASIKDIRVVLIKLADRLHNMRSIQVFREDKRRRIARDALEIYAPIAHKLGIASLKWQLEDLSFKNLNPEMYTQINESLQQTQKQREKEVEKIKELLADELKKDKVKFEITGRPKHIYSIYRKMSRKKLSFEDIYDLRAVRIITKDVRNCYEILGILHNLWTPIPKEFDDYIANPKSNMYQSLHTVVIGPTKKPIEIQIRTKEMHKIAEQGIAAHWKYKGIKTQDKKFELKLNWMMQINEWQKDSKDAKEFLKMLHIDFFEDEIFTFTPRGRVIELPSGATVLDFAFSVHSELGEKCVAAKVNGHFVPLRKELLNGDLVEIITSKKQKPSREWLKFVRTSKAQSKIKQYIRSTQKIPVKSYAKVKEVKEAFEQWIVDVDNLVKPDIRFSLCCRPLPGDKIVGFATKTEKVSIHKKECPFTKRYLGGTRRKKVNVKWIDKIQSLVDVKVEAEQRTGLFAEILNTLIALKTPIKSAQAKPAGGDLVESVFTMEVTGISHLQNIVERIKKIQSVKQVYIGTYKKK